MEDTQCHIHFPDSNRSKQFDKSNQVNRLNTDPHPRHTTTFHPYQVSIAGQPSGVEAARRRIRVNKLIISSRDASIPRLIGTCSTDTNL